MISYIKGMIQKLINLFGLKKSKTEVDEQLPSMLQMWRFYLKYFKVQWKIILLFNSQFLITSFIIIRSPFVLVDIKNDIIDNNVSNSSNLLYHILEYIFYQLIISFQSLAMKCLQNHFRSNLKSKIESQIVNHLLQLDISYFEENKVSQITSEIQEGVSAIANDFLYNQLIQDMNSNIQYIGQAYFIYAISSQIALFIFLASLFFGIIQQYLTIKISEQRKKKDQQKQYQTFALDDIINNIHVIKGFGQEQKEIDTLRLLIQKNEVYNQKSSNLSMLRNINIKIQYDVLIILIIYQFYKLRSSNDQSAISTIQNQTEIMDCIHSFTFMAQFLIETLQQKQTTDNQYRQRSVSKIMKLFEKKSSIYSNLDNDTQIVRLTGDMSFENVGFKYPKINDKLAKMNQKLRQKKCEDQNNIKLGSSESLSNSEESDEVDKQKSVLNNLSFQIKQGQFVAFVGKSGSGKSTIAKLIQRLYNPNEGNILINGQDIKDISHKNLKQSIGYVSQEPTLLDNDIEYNIAYGCLNDEYTQEEMKRACDISGVSEFIFDKKRFPDGLKTLIGANGAKLSGGQKQRVALARALIKNPSILLLDEATSSLDAESEYVVQKYIDGIVEKRGMTIIVIAHRLSTIIKSDTIFVMKHGEIKEQGTHQQLISQDALYKKLVYRQIQFKTIEHIKEL